MTKKEMWNKVYAEAIPQLVVGYLTLGGVNSLRYIVAGAGGVSVQSAAKRIADLAVEGYE